MNSRKLQGTLMAIVGFILLLINAMAYLMDWDIKNSSFTILGLVFVAIGLKYKREA